MSKVAVITGASSGIGRALSKELSKDYRLYLCGRNMEELKLTAATLSSSVHGFELIQLDLNDTTSIRMAAEQITNSTEKIDLLINNAGLSQRAIAAETSIEMDRKIMEVNFFGPVEFTKLLLPALRKAKNSKIAVTSSIVGKFGYPLRSTYSAAKHALHGYFESLRFEERINGIQIQFWVVGRVKTNVSINALTQNGEKYNKMDKGQSNGISAEKCAQKMIKVIRSNKKEVLIGGQEIWMVLFKKYLPTLFYKIASKEKNHV